MSRDRSMDALHQVMSEMTEEEIQAALKGVYDMGLLIEPITGKLTELLDDVSKTYGPETLQGVMRGVLAHVVGYARRYGNKEDLIGDLEQLLMMVEDR
jgi:hypothetical protein